MLELRSKPKEQVARPSRIQVQPEVDQEVYLKAIEMAKKWQTVKELGVGEGVIVGVGEGVGVGEAEGVAVGEGEGVVRAENRRVGVGVGELVTVGFGEGVAVGVGVDVPPLPTPIGVPVK